MTVVQDETAWMEYAACRGKATDLFFPSKDDVYRAKRVCSGCPVIRECRDYAIRNECEGVWGGTTDEERESGHWRAPHPTQLDPPPETRLGKVVDETARALGEHPWMLRGSSRRVPLVHHRQVAFAVCRRITGASLPTIGREFRRDHTTVMHGIQRVESDPHLSQLADRITAEVMALPNEASA